MMRTVLIWVLAPAYVVLGLQLPVSVLQGQIINTMSASTWGVPLAPSPSQTSPVATAQFEASSPQMSEVATIQFHPHADVILVLEVKRPLGCWRTCRFKVNSTVLCLTSPVFTAMFGVNSQFQEAHLLQLARQDCNLQPVEVALYDDNPNALAMILRILHHQFDFVPPTLPAARLYQIAILCDKYDLRQALSFCFLTWIPAKTLADNFLPSLPLDKRLFIAHVLQRPFIFRTLTKDVLLTWKVGPNGELQGPGCTGPPSKGPCPFLPEMVMGKSMPRYHLLFNVYHELRYSLERLVITRKAIVDKLFDMVSTQISNSIQGITRCKHNQAACDSFVLGTLMLEFQRLNIYPESKNIRQHSIQEIRDLLVSMKSPQHAFFDNITSTCCNNPMMCRCVQYPCSLCEKKSCKHCGKTYKNSHKHGLNHITCLPIAALIAQVNLVVKDVQGLEHQEFVQKVMTHTNNKDLWDCLTYT